MRAELERRVATIVKTAELCCAGINEAIQAGDIKKQVDMKI
jgi:hypothetical protein